jgi:hypothetical protein
MARDNYIAAAWESYLARVMPADASVTQIAETRQAFFGGAAVLFTMMTLPMEGNQTDEQIGDFIKDFMKALSHEIHIFGAELDLEVLGIRKH